MKLTPSQIQYVSDYIVSKNFKWYELQIELTDHLVLEMEKIWEQNPEWSFKEVKFLADKTFGRNGLKKIQKERIENLRKEYKKEQYKLVGEYLKFPKIVLSIIAIFFIYKMSFYFETASYIKFFSGILLFASVITILNWVRYRKIKGHSFLSIETAYSLNNTAIFGAYMSLIWSDKLNDKMDENHLRLLPFCIFWVLGILFIITGRHLTNTIIEKVKKQYQLS